MSDMAKAGKEAQTLENILAKSSVTLGTVEKAQLKLTKAMHNAPVIKQMLQMKQLHSGFQKLLVAQQDNKDAQEEGNQEQEKGGTVLMRLSAVMLSYGAAAKLAGKGTGTLSKSLFSLSSSVLFLFGIFALLTLGAVALAVAFADVSSPLSMWLTDIPVIGELMNGLKIIMTGEDGESGLKGAVDVLVVALVAGAAAWMLFGAPVAILVATLVAAVGIFNWMKNKTDSTVAALIAAGAVVMGGLTALFAWIGGAFATFAGAIMLPITLILAGITGMWLSITGEISYWWGVISAIITGIGVVLLGFATGFITVLSLPVLAIGAAVAAIIFTIVYFWDEIVDFFEMIWDGILGFCSMIWDGFMAGIDWVGGIFDSILTAAGGFIDDIMGIFAGLWEWAGNVWQDFEDMLSNVFSGIADFFIGIGKYIAGAFSAGWKFLASIPGKIKDAVLGILKGFGNFLVKKWNSWIAGIVPKMTIPKWVPFLGGKSFGPFPDEMEFFAEGGLVNKPTLGMIGEAGPEAVIPLKGGRVPVQLGGAQYSDATMKAMIRAVSKAVTQHGNTFNITINTSGIVATSERAKKELADEMSKIILMQIQKTMTKKGPMSIMKSMW